MSRSAHVRRRGFTLIELIVAVAILAILTGLALPMARNAIKRQKERELRGDLQMMRDALDRFKDAADRKLIREKGDDSGYPKTLEMLQEVEINGGKKVRFLGKVPVDPMTGKADWGMRSMEDDPDSDSWDGTAVFDVYSKSDGTAMDGTKYRNW